MCITPLSRQYNSAPRGIPYIVSSSERGKREKEFPSSLYTKDCSSPCYPLGFPQPSLPRNPTALAKEEFSCLSPQDPMPTHPLPEDVPHLQPCHHHMPTLPDLELLYTHPWYHEPKGTQNVSPELTSSRVPHVASDPGLSHIPPR